MITHTTEWKSEEDTPPRPWFRFYDGGHKASEDDMEPFSAGQPESNREFSEKETFEEIGALEGRETEKAEATEEETEEEPVEWDGSEAQLVLEDDAAEYESPQTGIRLSCDLKEKEIFEALRRFPFTKRAGKRAVIEAVLLLLASGLFFYQYFWMKTGQAVFLAVACIILAGVVLFVPWLGRRRMAARMEKDPRKSHVEMEIYPDSIDVGSGEGQWEIPLDGSCEMEEYKNMLLLFPRGRNAMVILPLRCIEPSVLPEIQGMLFSGTSTRETEEGN